MDKERFEFLTERTSAGFALVQDHAIDRVCIMDKCGGIIYDTTANDIWVEYPKDTWQKRFQWLAPDRLGFFREGLWGMMAPDGEVIIPDQFQFIVPFEDTDYFILKDRLNFCGCVDKDFNILYPSKYEYKELRQKLRNRFHISIENSHHGVPKT